MSKDFLTQDEILLNLKLSPDAKRTSIKCPYGESAIRLTVTTPPADGKANVDVDPYLTKLPEIPRSTV